MKEEVWQTVCELYKTYKFETSGQYDRLDVPKKPSRWTLRQYFGPWKVMLQKLKDSIPTLPDERKPPDEIAEQDEVRKLREQIEGLRRHFNTPKHHLHLKGEVFSLGVVSDTHVGSLFCDYGLLDAAYKIFKSRGIELVLHAGDFFDGQKMYRGHEFEVEVIGADEQVKLAVERYPYVEGIKTYFINGNHDRSFWKRAGVDIGQKITTVRPDIVYLGYQEEDIILGESFPVVIRLFHPEGTGSAYALSYLAQRYISELTSSNKPHILIHGHTHKFNYMYYQDVFVLQAGTLQRQTPFMRGKKIACHLGFSILEITTTKQGISRTSIEFFPCHD
ncbi:MAG: metallophosphoesterase family protein [Candidatus Methanomethylicaceae archaeon]